MVVKGFPPGLSDASSELQEDKYYMKNCYACQMLPNRLIGIMVR